MLMNDSEMMNKFLKLIEGYIKQNKPEFKSKRPLGELEEEKAEKDSSQKELLTNDIEANNLTEQAENGNQLEQGDLDKKEDKKVQSIESGNKEKLSITLGDNKKLNAKALIGRTVTASKELVFYDPKRENQNLANMNMMITGSSGKGKTQLLKSLVLQKREQGVNFIIFDYKNDFSNDENFIKDGGFEYVNLERKGLPYNPLIPPVKTDNNEKYWNVQSHIFSIDGVLSKVYGLKEQQASSLRQSIRSMFTDNGVPLGRDEDFSEEIKFPNLDSLDEYLKKENQMAYNRMEPIFSLGLFGDEYKNSSLMNLLKGSYIFNLSSIEHDVVKNAITKMVIINAHQFLNSLPHTQELRNVFVFDEAHRILNEDRILSLVRECRAYGLGVWLSSQYTSDYPEEITGSLETKIIHGNGNEADKIKDIKKTTGFSGSDEIVANLDLFDAIVCNSHYPNKLIKTISYPHMLIIRALKSGGISMNDDIIGVENSRKIEMINHLIEINIIYEKDGFISLTEDGLESVSEMNF
jgi:DNA helicase HerA-like ATPase